jgi:uncharacterized membrane protein YfcA
MILVTLFFIGFASWLVATLTAGGAGVIYLALASFSLSVPVATVTLGIAGGITGAYRVWIYRHDFSRKILPRLLPGTIIGAVAGSSLFGIMIASEHLKTLQIFLAIFLMSSGVSGLFKLKPYGENPKLLLFFPMGMFTGFISGLIGAAGPMMNGLFQAFDLKPQQIVGTKSLNIFIQQMVKAVVYTITILLSGHESLMQAGLDLKTIFLFSCDAAAGGAIGVYVGRTILGRTRSEVFNTVLNAAMVLYGLHLAYVVYDEGTQ